MTALCPRRAPGRLPRSKTLRPWAEIKGLLGSPYLDILFWHPVSASLGDIAHGPPATPKRSDNAGWHKCNGALLDAARKIFPDALFRALAEPPTSAGHQRYRADSITGTGSVRMVFQRT